MTTATMSRLNFTGIEEGGQGNTAPNGADNRGAGMRRAAFTLTSQSGRTVQVWLTCADDNLLDPLARALSRVDLHLPDTA